MAVTSEADEYGGSEENRMRFLNQVLDAVLEVWQSHCVGIRLTPENSFNSMSDSDPQAHFNYFITQLNSRDLAYLHILEGDMMSASRNVDYRALRDAYDGFIYGKQWLRQNTCAVSDCEW